MWQQNLLKNYKEDFLIRLSELLKSGFTQFEAIQFLLSQYESVKPNVKEQVVEQIKRGTSLSDILITLHYPQNISTQIYFAEQFGDVTHSLIECYNYLEMQKKSKRQFVKAVQYPLILITIFFVLIIIVNQTVLPQFQDMYTSMGVEVSRELSMLTNLIFILPNILIVLTVFITMLLLIGVLIYKQSSLEVKLALIKKIPVISKLFRQMITYRISLELSFFLSNGVMMNHIIQIFKEQNKDPLINYIGSEINDSLLEGYTLKESIESIGLFEPSMLQFIAHGEQNSKVEIELKYYANYTFNNLQQYIMKMIKWIQPIVFLALGFLIISLYLVIILPMLQMMSGIQS